MCIHVFPAFMNTHHLCVWCPQKLEEGVRSLKPESQKVVSCHVGAGN